MIVGRPISTCQAPSARDASVFEDALGIGFFLYGPRLWMVGEIEPLKELQRKETRSDVIPKDSSGVWIQKTDRS